MYYSNISSDLEAIAVSAISIIIKYLAMKLTDKLKHYLCLVLAIVTCLMVALIAILSWGIVLFAIYDINTSHTFHSIEVYKISAAFWALLALPSHVFCQIIMYDDKIYAYVMSWIKNHSTKWQVVLSLGYINTYMLDLYFIKNKYTRDFVTYNTDSTESFWIMFPILNLIVYYNMIKDCRSDKGLKEKNSALLKLFVKGQLVTYLIRNY